MKRTPNDLAPGELKEKLKRLLEAGRRCSCLDKNCFDFVNAPPHIVSHLSLWFEYKFQRPWRGVRRAYSKRSSRLSSFLWRGRNFCNLIFTCMYVCVFRCLFSYFNLILMFCGLFILSTMFLHSKWILRNVFFLYYIYILC